MTAIASSNSFSPPQQQQNGFSDRDESAEESMDTACREDQNHNNAVVSPSHKPLSDSSPHRNGSSGSASKQKNEAMVSPPKLAEVKPSMSSDDDEDNIPWDQRIAAAAGSKKVEHSKKTTIVEKVVKEPSTSKRKSDKEKKKRQESDQEESEEDYEPEDDDEDDYQPKKKKSKAVVTPKSELKIKIKREIKRDSVTPDKPSSSKHKVTAIKKTKKEIKEEIGSPSKTQRKKKVVEEEEVWRWWEEEKKEDGIKWKTLEHKGPLFAPPYEPLPKSVKFLYDGKEMHLSEAAEEVAGFYGKMLDHEYTSKEVFNINFFKDFRKVMTPAEREKITDLTKCNFKQMHAHFLSESEKRKAMSKEQKLKIKEEKEAEAKEYGHAFIDGHKQKIGNFRIEPPGLFRGRGDHPKMGRLKRRIQPEDVIINCGKSSKTPVPPPGHKWKEIRHDNTVTWLCGWSENVLGSNKYIMLNPSSKIKGEKDWEKFETARALKGAVDEIRRLALRAGNEKDTDEAADTVGCCSLRCEHVKLLEESDGQKFVVVFDFLGKDSIRYFNQVPVEKQVFKNLKIFMEGKEPGDDLFDRLDTSGLNVHLRSLMPGLTAKVFRTYNASITLQEQLDKLTQSKDTIHEKMLSYNRANRQVAILCNHQRAVPKTHEKSMENLENKIKDKKKELKDAKAELQKTRGAKEKEKIEKKIDRLKETLKRMKTQRTDKDENKQIALGTSKLNYLDPRISVAWCKKNDVNIEKIFNKTQREKFRWAIDMATEDYVF